MLFLITELPILGHRSHCVSAQLLEPQRTNEFKAFGTVETELTIKKQGAQR